MLGLPKSTELKKQLSKTAVFKKFSLNSAARTKFDADISRLDITGEISPSTAAIKAGENISSIYVICVSLKQKDFDEKNIILTAKLINQKMLFVLKYEDQAKLAVYNIKLLQSAWKPLDEYNIRLTGLDLDEVWQNLIIHAGGLTLEAENTLDQQIILNEKRQKLQKQIETLEKQAWAEKQPRKKWGLADEIRRLKIELGGNPND